VVFLVLVVVLAVPSFGLATDGLKTLLSRSVRRRARPTTAPSTAARTTTVWVGSRRPPSGLLGHCLPS
jgi:hypothetical protein